MNDIEPRAERARDLAEFANAGSQPNQPIAGGHALVRPTTGLADRIIGAQHVAVYRDEAKILQKLSALAAAAGSDWFYRFPVRTKEGQSWIEGASIKLANDVARIFGNNVNEVRELDLGDAWVFYARFTDIETGFSMERAYRQRKTQTSLKTKDADRQLDIAYQIGQSKAIRNCICNALQIYCDYAFDEARKSLVDKIGKDLAGWRKRTLEGIARMPIELARVERVMGRAAKDWLAPDLAQVIAMMKSIADGMASADETFPPLAEAKAPAPVPEATQAAPETAKAATETANPTAATSVPAAADKAAAAAETEDAAASLRSAYARGQDWKHQGRPRAAVPPEYRDAAHSREALCWQAGFDDAPMPTFGTERSGSA